MAYVAPHPAEDLGQYRAGARSGRNGNGLGATPAQLRRRARRQRKRARKMSRSAVGRARLAAATVRVAAGTASKQERRLARGAALVSAARPRPKVARRMRMVQDLAAQAAVRQRADAARKRARRARRAQKRAAEARERAAAAAPPPPADVIPIRRVVNGAPPPVTDTGYTRPPRPPRGRPEWVDWSRGIAADQARREAAAGFPQPALVPRFAPELPPVDFGPSRPPFDFPTRRPEPAAVAEPAAAGAMPAWLIPAAIGAAAFLL